MLSSYKIEGNKVEVKTAYSDHVVTQCRKWAGKFDKAKSAWVLPITRLPEVQNMLGVNLEDQVEVEVGHDHLSGYQQLRLGWYILAGRRGRDYRADVYADLVAGEIPSSGGSMKNPGVCASNDVRFRLWVPRDFAEARSLEIVTDPKNNETETAAEIQQADPLAAVRELIAAGDRDLILQARDLIDQHLETTTSTFCQALGM